MMSADSIPTVSVIICTRRRPELLPRAIRSVLAQTWRDLELIVVDDASGDTTPSVIKSFDDPRVHLVSNSVNLGHPGSRNQGLANARGRMIAFLDDDDEWVPDKLQLQVPVLDDEDPSCGAVWSHSVWEHADGTRTAKRIPLEGWVNVELQRDDIVMMQPLLVRREVFDKIGGFDPTMKSLDDYEFSLRLSRSFQITTLHADLVIMHVTPASLSMNHQGRADDIRTLLDRSDAMTDRTARARWAVRLAGNLLASGDRGGWFRAVMLGVRTQPWSPRPWGALVVGGAGGSNAVAAIGRIRNRRSRSRRHQDSGPTTTAGTRTGASR